MTSQERRGTAIQKLCKEMGIKASQAADIIDSAVMTVYNGNGNGNGNGHGSIAGFSK